MQVRYQAALRPDELRIISEHFGFLTGSKIASYARLADMISAALKPTANVLYHREPIVKSECTRVWPDGLTLAAGGATINVMEPRIASLEAITENTAKGLEELRRRVDEGFREIRCEIRDLRAEVNEKIDDLRAEVKESINNLRGELRAEIRDVRDESNERSKELRTEMRESFRWLVGIQITTLLALLGLFAMVADVF